MQSASAAPFAIAFADIEAAAQRIAPYLAPTPLQPLADSSRTTSRLLAKLEVRQPTGSFKVRGALNAMIHGLQRAKASGVVACSTGNHARAVAWAAARFGVGCEVFVSRMTPDHKVTALRGQGVTLHVVGRNYDEAEAAARLAAQDKGALFIPPFDDPLVMAGQGVIGVELAASETDFGAVIVPVSGGGLCAGVCLALRHLRPHVRILGVTMENGAAMHASIKAGRPVAVEEAPSLADSLGGGVGGAQSRTFPIVSALLDDLLLVSEAQIARAMVAAMDEHGLRLEGAAAAALALAHDARIAAAPGPIVVIASGENVDPTTFDRLREGVAG